MRVVKSYCGEGRGVGGIDNSRKTCFGRMGEVLAGKREKGKFYPENFWNVPFIFFSSRKKAYKSIFSYNASPY